jgi:hypothetical protein
VRPAFALAVASCVAGCVASAPPPGACEASSWIDDADPPAISLHASGAVTWDGRNAVGEPIVLDGTLVRATDGAVTTIEIDTASGVVEVAIGVSLSRLGVLPLGRPVQLSLGDAMVLTNEEGHLQTAVVSRRGASEASAGIVTFRQSYAECVRSTMDEGCWRVMASPLVDVVTGASVVRVPPGSSWRIPNDESPTAEIEIVRSVRAPDVTDDVDLPTPLCAAAPAQEITAIIRHLR